MNNPFSNLNAAGMSPEQLRSIHVDRQAEIEEIVSSLAEHSKNVLLYGARGTGKTFLTRLVGHRIQESHKEVLLSRFNVYSSFVSGVDSQNDSSKLPSFILLQLCVDIWKTVLEKDYLELRDSLTENVRAIKVTTKAERTVVHIYSLLMRQEEISYSHSNKVGGSLVVNAELSEQQTSRLKSVPIQPFEFSELVDMLMRDVLLPAGLSRIAVLCDEANNLSIYLQEEMLSRFLEIFSSRKVQFLFVAGGMTWDENPLIPSCFETSLELRGFSEEKHINELINLHLQQSKSSALSFSPEALEVLFQNYSGHPRKTLTACRYAYERAQKACKSAVDLKTILQAARDVAEDERRWREMESPSPRSAK